ncbi:MAG: Uncharacterized MFS-type transporter, partial [uncultured Nocardioides sp.]
DRHPQHHPPAGHAPAGAQPDLGARPDLDRPADGRARRDHRQHRAPVHPEGPGDQRRQPLLDRDGLRPRLRQPAAPGRAAGRPLRPPPGLHRRPGRLRRGLAPRRPGDQRGAPAGRSRPPGTGRRPRLARRPGPHHHDLPRRQGAQPRLRRVRRDVGRRGGRRSHPGRLADRPRPAARDRRLAPDLPHQRPDRDRRRPAVAEVPQRVGVAPRPAGPAGRRDRHARPPRGRLRPLPRGHGGLDRHLDGRQPRRGRRAAGTLRRRREPGGAPAAAVPGLHQPHPRRELRGDVPRTRGDVRDVLLPEPVHPERHGVHPAQGRRRLPAVHARHRGRGRAGVQPGQPDRPSLHLRRGHPAGGRRPVRLLPAALRHLLPRGGGDGDLRRRPAAVHRPDGVRHGAHLRARHPHGRPPPPQPGLGHRLGCPEHRAAGRWGARSRGARDRRDADLHRPWRRAGEGGCGGRRPGASARGPAADAGGRPAADLHRGVDAGLPGRGDPDARGLGRDLGVPRRQARRARDLRPGGRARRL